MPAPNFSNPGQRLVTGNEVDTAVSNPERLVALHRTGLLDAPPEPAFDRLTRLAARLLKAPIGLVTLVDENRQFFLSAHGVPEPLASERGTPLSYSFCKYVVAADEPIIIEDSRQHPLVWDNPATTERNTLAYVGIPLHTPDGHTIGSLCVADTTPRQWSEDEVLAMQDLCDLAARELVVREHLRERTRFADRLGEISPALVYLLDIVERRILHISENVHAILGYTADEIEALGSDLLPTLMHPEDLAQFQTQMEALSDLAPGESIGFQYRMRHADGSWRTLYGRDIVYERDEGGKPRRILGSALDVSEVKKSEAAAREVEEERKKADALSRGVFENSGDCIKLLTLEGRLVSMNGSGMRLLEVESFETLRGSYWVNLWEGDARKAVEQALAQACAGGQGRFQAPCRTEKGAIKFWDVIVSPIIKDGGTPDQLLAISRDITTIKQAEEAVREREARLADQKEAFELAVSGAPFDEVLDVLVRAGQRRFGPESQTAILIVDTKTASLRFGAAAGLAESFTPAIDQLEIGPNSPSCGLAAHKGELIVVNDVEGDPRWIPYAELTREHGIRSCWSFPIRSSTSETLGTFTVYQPVPCAPGTDDLEALKILAQTAAVIIERHKVEDALSQAKERAEAASRAKDRFLATLSHELRNPLNPVLLTATEMLSEPAVSNESREAWEMVRKNVALEAKLIDDILDLSRISHGKMALTFTEVDAHEILRDAIQTVNPQIETKEITLTIELGAQKTLLRGDAVRLQQVFWNVLNNGAKFTPNNGSIMVRTRNGVGNTLVVEVGDTGIGMTGEELALLFEAFAQGEHAIGGGSPAYGGLGLGLVISRQLIQMHGGTISAASGGRDRGTIFTIELPALEAGELERSLASNPVVEPISSLEPLMASARGQSSAEIGKAALRILLVEDHPMTRSTLARLLARRGYEVIPVGTVAEARAFARQRQFDLVLSDIGLPDGDGHTLMAELRDALGPDLCGIAMSGFGMPEDLARSRDVGFSAHLIKPVEVAALDAAISEIAGGKILRGDAPGVAR